MPVCLFPKRCTKAFFPGQMGREAHGIRSDDETVFFSSKAERTKRNVRTATLSVHYIVQYCIGVKDENAISSGLNYAEKFQEMRLGDCYDCAFFSWRIYGERCGARATVLEKQEQTLFKDLRR